MVCRHDQSSLQPHFLLLSTAVLLLLDHLDISHGFAAPSATRCQLRKSCQQSRDVSFLVRPDHRSWRVLSPNPHLRHRRSTRSYASSVSWSGSQTRRDSLTTVYNSQHQNSEQSSQERSIKVGIVGAGSIAFGTASIAASLGHHPMIWSPSGAGTRELVHHATATPYSIREQITDSNSITSQIQSTGALIQDTNVHIARSPRELVQYCDNVLILALPVNGHKKVMEDLAPYVMDSVLEQRLEQPYIKDGLRPMHIIISSHASLGAVYFMQLLRKEWRRHVLGPDDDNTTFDDLGVRITAWGTTVITARKTSGTSVNILTVRQSVDFCTVPSIPESMQQSQKETMEPIMNPVTNRLELITEDGCSLCTTLFGPRFKHREGGLLAISLSNLNPQNHLGIVLGNMSRMDPPPPPPPPPDFDLKTVRTSLEAWYQFKNITPNVGRLMEALDRERLAIAEALDIDVRTIYEHFSWSFHVPIETPVTDLEGRATSANEMRPSTVSEMNQQMHHYLDNDVLGPSSPDSRYVLEDVPYGLVLTVILGQLVGRPAILHESGIMILSAMYGRDFMVENELLQGLGLVKGDMIPSLDIWRDMAYSGYFRDRSVWQQRCQ